MKKRITSILTIISLILIFVIFYKSLNKNSFYKPKSKIKDIPQFVAKSFYSKEELDSSKLFDENNYYLFNIWASWCVPCKEEHPFLINLSNNKNLTIIGLNYKDKAINAEKFLNNLGNPFKKILLDQNGAIAIDWGAIGVPETFLVYQNRIIKKFIGPLDQNSLKEIEQIIK